VKLGHYIEHELRQLLSSPSTPVALPGPEERSPAKDVVGPILPLNAIGAEKASELLGAAKTNYTPRPGIMTMRGKYRSFEEAERMQSRRDAIRLAGGLVATAIVLAMILVGIVIVQ